MILRSILLALAVPVALFVTGCSGAGDASTQDPASEDALATSDLKDHGLAVGIIATGDEARKLYEAIEANGGKDLGDHAMLAGITGKDVGFTDPDDAKQGFGISCQGKEGDHTFHADTCSLYAVVEMAGQDKRDEAAWVVNLTGKIAKAVATALPRTSPEGLVGSMSTGVGKLVQCKIIPGPAGASCKVPVMGAVMTFEDAIKDPEANLKAADAKKIIKAFY